MKMKIGNIEMDFPTEDFTKFGPNGNPFEAMFSKFSSNFFNQFSKNYQQMFTRQFEGFKHKKKQGKPTEEGQEK